MGEENGEQPVHSPALYGFPPELRIRKRREFLQVQSKGRSHHTRHFVVVVGSGATERNRIGITVSLRVDKRAVVRNRIKRRIRELFRHVHREIRTAFDIVIIARQNAGECTGADIAQELYSALSRAKLVVENRS